MLIIIIRVCGKLSVKKELANRVLKTLEYLYESTEKTLKSFGNLESLCSNWVKVFIA
jgi:hypothetical protein